MEHWNNKKVIERLLRNFIEIDGCWVSTTFLNEKGYGRIKIEGKYCRNNRVSFYLFIDDLIDGLVIDHTCKNRACYNPEHLRQITNSLNLIGRRWKNRV